ncbi:GerAB/ArcD/ProY family transporter [Clostridium fungisolvens]|uniref:Spore germination protein n=1 Tax=Clostridium fungisolvens TaxID=1604897 RepID=A0A6V8SLL9_9CLOT|nr:GerAB/ArcD/ProY family transporter [Clostridium fungisolvens]GFP77656.1 hypothetical protein bsdtw1_03815 [Clostridium fungisolvens]
MKRYFFYIVLINSFTNIIIFLPEIILPAVNEGGLLSIFLSLPFGTIMMYIFLKTLIRFPNKTLSEILEITCPRWVQITIMLLFGPAWYISGLLMLSSTLDMTNTFMDPHTSTYLLLLLYVFLIIYAIRMKGTTLLYVLEIFMLFISPTIIFIYVKGVTDPFFCFDACVETVSNLFTLPKLSVFAVTTYSFTGYTDMVVFNKYYKGTYPLKLLWIFPITEFLLMSFAFLIPLGFLGTQNVDNYNFPWITSADCMLIKTGIIERTLFIYLLIYLVTSLVNIIIHWHVSLDIFKQLFKNQLKLKNTKLANLFILCVFAVIPFFYKHFVPQIKSELVVKLWLSLRLFMEFFLVMFLVFVTYNAHKKGRI